jgi:hypothetical protein
MSKEKQIRKVTLQASGLKGLIIEGTYESVKDNKIVINNYKDTVKHPITLDLEDKVKDLRFNLLEICGLITDSSRKDEKLSLLGGSEVVSVEYQPERDYFIIKGMSRVFDTKYIKLTTPKVDNSDGYENYDTVVKIIEAVFYEVDQYAKGLKKISDEELALSFIRHGKGGEIDEDAFMKMNNEEKAEYCTKVLEKLGCLVIRNEDMDINDVDLTEEINELKASTGEVELDFTVEIPEPIKLSK